MCDSFCTSCCISSQMVLQLLQVYNHTDILFEFDVNIWIFQKPSMRRGVLQNINLSNLENTSQSNLRTERMVDCIFLASGRHKFWIFFCSAPTSGAFTGSMYVPVCPKNLWVHNWTSSNLPIRVGMEYFFLEGEGLGDKRGSA